MKEEEENELERKNGKEESKGGEGGEVEFDCIIEETKQDKTEKGSIIEEDKLQNYDHNLSQDELIQKAKEELSPLENETERVVFNMNLQQYFDRFIKDGCVFGYKQLFAFLGNST